MNSLGVLDGRANRIVENSHVTTLPHPLRLLLLLGVAAASCGSDMPAPKTLPAPPSVAVDGSALPATARVALVVDAIPPDAKYVIYAEMKLDGVTIKPEDAARVGADLSRTFEQLFALARQRGANLVVLFSNEHGVDIPIRQCATPLRLRSQEPRVVAVLFKSAQAATSASLVRRVRFTTRLTETPKESIAYKITLAKDTAGITKAYWTYGNIARFVADAVARGYDTVAIKSTSDTPSEDVWLPGCDSPVRVSLAHPVLDVTIYKTEKPDRSANAASSADTSAASHR